MKELYSEIEIHASPERVWQVLTDFDRFQDWNPFIRSVAGKPSPGARLSVKIQQPGGRIRSFRPKIMKFEKEHEIRWRGGMLVPGLFDGQHTFKIEPLGPDRVLFIQREKFKGLLVRFLSRSLDNETRNGFKQMNAALKARAEKPN